MKHLSIGLSALIALLILPAFVFAQTALININTADAATLDTLPGIGPAKAQAIVDFRDANGSFAIVEDIQEVSGIGPSTFAEIEPFITVTDDAASVAQDASVSASSTTPVAPAAGGASTYTPPPAGLSVSVSVSPATALMEVPLSFTVIVKERSGSADPSAHVIWSFGDGSSGEGNAVEKTYHYAGTYLVVATAEDGGTTAQGELEVAVEPSAARIAAISGEGILLANDGDARLDLSRWRFTSSQGIFRIPQGTTILPHASILFPFTVMNLPVALDATLTYPDGVTAAAYLPPAAAVSTTTAVRPLVEIEPSLSTATVTAVAMPAVQPSSASAGSEVQTVDTITSPSAPQPSHENTAVIAPAAAKDLAAAGAAVPLLATSSPAAATPSSLFRSSWAFGLTGVMAAAAGFFIFL